jgi:hypothetical protein
MNRLGTTQMASLDYAAAHFKYHVAPGSYGGKCATGEKREQTVVALATASRQRGGSEEKKKKENRELLRHSRQILNDAWRVIADREEMSAKKQRSLGGHCEQLRSTADRGNRVVLVIASSFFEV